MAPSSRCAHALSTNKKLERIQNLVAFAKKATPQQITTRLSEVWAAPECSLTDVRILFVLGADPAQFYVDDYGEKKLNERREAGSICAQCAPKYHEFLRFARQIYNAQFGQSKLISPLLDKKPQPRNGRRNKKQIVLSLDGGGMRGLVSITTLLFASRRICGDESLVNLVDWTIGCSTGSMLGLALAKGNSLSECFFLYWEMKNEIFLDKSTMKRLFGNVVDKQTIRVNTVLNRVFNEESDTFLQSHQRLTVPALDISTTPAKLHVFRNYAIRDRQPEDVSFRDAARASSAAPTYFHPFVMGERKFVDGSLVANCPLSILFAEYDKSLQIGDDIQIGLVISIGTGEPAETKRRYQSGTTIGRRGAHIRDMFILLAEQAVGYEKSVIQCAEDRCAASGIPFFRLCPVGIAVRIDQVDDDKLMQMIWDSMLHLFHNCDIIDELGLSLADLCGDQETPASSRQNSARRNHSAEPHFRQRRQTTSS